MEVPVELLTDGMDKDRIFRVGEIVHVLTPERNRETDEQDNVDEHDRELEVGRDRAGHALIIGAWMTAAAETDETVNEEGGPPDKKRAHEPVRELDDVIDLKAVLRDVRRLAEELVNQGEATNHTAQDFPR